MTDVAPHSTKLSKYGGTPGANVTPANKVEDFATALSKMKATDSQRLPSHEPFSPGLMTRLRAAPYLKLGEEGSPGLYDGACFIQDRLNDVLDFVQQDLKGCFLRFGDVVNLQQSCRVEHLKSFFMLMEIWGYQPSDSLQDLSKDIISLRAQRLVCKEQVDELLQQLTIILDDVSKVSSTQDLLKDFDTS